MQSPPRRRSGSDNPRERAEAKSDDEVTRVVAELHGLAAIDRSLTLAESYRAGELVATLAGHRRFTGAGGGVWIRELHRTLGSGFSLASLHRHHAVFSMLRRLQLEPVFRHLGRAHLRAIATLPAGKQRSVIRRADKERWTSRELEEWIAVANKGVERGRRRQPLIAKRVRALREFADEPIAELTKLEGIDALAPDQVEDLTKILRATQRRTMRLLAKLGPRCN